MPSGWLGGHRVQDARLRVGTLPPTDPPPGLPSGTPVTPIAYCETLHQEHRVGPHAQSHGGPGVQHTDSDQASN